jgi:hypothetical protein
VALLSLYSHVGIPWGKQSLKQTNPTRSAPREWVFRVTVSEL